nr:uncharacterized protein LOC113807794 [Penaeus vannamei]
MSVAFFVFFRKRVCETKAASQTATLDASVVCMPLVVDRYNWPQVPYDMRQHVSLEERQRATSSRQERATPKEHRGAAEEQRGFPSAVQHATCFSLFLAEHNLPFIFAMTWS